jgi:hypothetical protein
MVKDEQSQFKHKWNPVYKELFMAVTRAWESNLQIGNARFGSGCQRFLSVVTWPHCFGLGKRRTPQLGGHGGAKQLASWWPGSKERDEVTGSSCDPLPSLALPPKGSTTSPLHHRLGPSPLGDIPDPNHSRMHIPINNKKGSEMMHCDLCLFGHNWIH